ncbi:Enterochelin esterase [Lutibacter oricola]|uniref:Enterochelin esterase n=1 Tax=Lutibacter oricola TaxID=762486 RepID=A0A1H2WQ03_9FLAO|nr:alpha/beta hydrolase-fold protein [Lutibacter oricola]SDW82635.1 Enterochelin esterase [Lutibacter oricola]
MKTKSHQILNKVFILITLFFSLLLIVSPVFSFVFTKYRVLPTYYFLIGSLFCWLLFIPFNLYKKINFKVYLFDVVLLIFSIYIILNFSIKSLYPFSYKYFLYTICYLCCILLFRYSYFFKKDTINKILFIQSGFIALITLIEACWTILQYFNVLKITNEFFTVTGSFTTPSALGSFLSTTLIILIGCFFFYLKTLKSKFLFSIAVIPIIIAIILSESRTSWIAVTTGIIFYLATSQKIIIKWKQTSKKIKALVTSVFIMLLIPISYLLYLLKPDSVDGRWLIYKISSQAIAEKTLFGYGLFNFSGYYNTFKANYFLETNRPWEEIKIANYVSTAMNDYLLVLFEIGIVGFLLIIIFFYFLFKDVKINHITRIAIATLACIGVQALFTSILYNNITVLLGCWSIGILMNQQQKPLFIFKKNHVQKTILSVLLSSIGVIGLVALNNKYIATKNYIKKEPSNSKYFIGNPNFEFDLGKRSFNQGDKKNGLIHMENAFIKSSYPKLNRKLISIYTSIGNYKKAEESLQLNIGLEPYRFQPRMDYLKFLIRTNNVNKQIEIAQSIIDLPIKIPSDTIQTFKNYASKIIESNLKHKNRKGSIQGTLSRTKKIKSKILNKTLLYNVYLPPANKITEKLPVIYINDGFNYIRHGKTQKVLDSLISYGAIKPIIAVFLEPKDAFNLKNNIRQNLFLCNSDFVDFFTKEFIPSIEKRYPVSNHKNDRAILGVSFGGLAAAYIANKAPNHFKYIAMQSPAFHPCRDIYRSYNTNPKRNFKMFMSYGTGKDTEKQDIPMINILNKKGYELKVRRIEGGNHKWNVWKKQIDEILIYFFETKILDH